MTAEMEFIVNHTHKQIRSITSVKETELSDFLAKAGWLETDKFDVVFLEHDGIDAFYKMLGWIEDDKYHISDEDRCVFAYDSDDLSEEFEESMVRSRTYSCERGFSGWDEPGAAFDW
jgi:hypothetical protein